MPTEKHEAGAAAGMSDKTLQRKLNQLAALANELHAEAQRRYGRMGGVFLEADGSLHIVSGDDMGRNTTASARQKFVKFTADGPCFMGAGAW
jgi:hypothetical protein